MGGTFMKKEIWKDIPNYESVYKINNYGIIKNKKTNRIKKTHINNSGYERVVLSKNGEDKNYSVHRLVAQAFIPNPNNFSQVNHKDENKANNSVDNLEWCTPSYNCRYGNRIKKIAEKTKITHKGKHYSPRTEFQKGRNAKKIINITTNKIYNSMQEAYKETNVPTSNISMCCQKKIKQAGGYIWRYL